MIDSTDRATAVVFDIGRVLIRWDLRNLFETLIDDVDELDFVLGHVVTEDWHFQQDAGRPLAEMVPERKAQYPEYAHLIDAYATRFNATIPGPVEGMPELARRLYDSGVPVFGLTNFGADFWDDFRREWPVFDGFRDIVVSGHEKCAKPDARIYQIAEQRFGLPAQSLLFVDDKAENIAAARARGWHGHVFDGIAGFEAVLRSHSLIR